MLVYTLQVLSCDKLNMILTLLTHDIRFFLRVDGVIAVIRETRMFCPFDGNPERLVHMEISWKEVMNILRQFIALVNV